MSKTSESVLSAVLLVVLVLVGVGVFFKQYRYEPSAFSHETSAVSHQPSAISFELSGYKAALRQEVYNADGLYEKIDGKADLYLGAGFKQLYCRVFTADKDPNLWMEIFAYDMGTPKNALAVFGVQRRPEGEAVGIGDLAYKTPDAVFLTKGKYYVEISGSAVSETLAMGMQELGGKFADSVAGEAGQIEELSLFPKENLAGQSFRLYVSDAFSFDGFKDLYAATYNANGSEITAFISKLPDAAAADKLAGDYQKFLVDNGGAAVAAANDALKGMVFDMGGEFEIVFAKGAFIGGVHGAEKQDEAEKIALKVMESLTK